MEKVIEEFNWLSEKPLAILSKKYNCRKAEVFYLKALDLLKQYPEFRFE